jgi:PEP-CTERM motif
MERSVFKYLWPLVGFVAVCLSHATTARAAEVTLTSGSVVLGCNEQVFEATRIVIAGQDFTLLFTSFPRPFPQCLPPRIDLNPGRFDGAVPLVTFQGVTTMETSGELIFDETSISGHVEGRELYNPNVVLFTVDFKGSGIGTISTTRSTFQVVPEPTTLILFGTGAALLGGARRLRHRKGAARRAEMSASKT